jgi:hypothetical protein
MITQSRPAILGSILPSWYGYSNNVGSRLSMEMQIMCSISRNKDFAHLKSRDSAVSVENRIQAGRPRSCDSNPVRRKRVLPSPKAPERLWGQNKILVGTGSTLPWREVFELWRWPSTPIEIDKLHSLAHMPSWWAKGAAEWCSKNEVSCWQYNTHHVLAGLENFTVVWLKTLFFRNMKPRHWVLRSWRFESTSKRRESITKRRGVISQKKGAVNCTCNKLVLLHFHFYTLHIHLSFIAVSIILLKFPLQLATVRHITFLSFTIPWNCSLQDIRISKNSLSEGRLRAQLT